MKKLLYLSLVLAALALTTATRFEDLGGWFDQQINRTIENAADHVRL